MASDLPLNARVFGTIIRALEAEGFSEDEAYYLAKRGAEFLSASHAPSGRSHGGSIFSALYYALKAEGVDTLEACRLAERGAQLLIALGALPDDRWELLRDCAAHLRAGERAVWTKGKSPGCSPGDAGSTPATATSLEGSSPETPET